MSRKEYLGDSVYVELNEGGQLRLTTENGYGPTNTIYLEPEVYGALMAYAARHSKLIERAKGPQP